MTRESQHTYRPETQKLSLFEAARAKVSAFLGRRVVAREVASSEAVSTGVYVGRHRAAELTPHEARYTMGTAQWRESNFPRTEAPSEADLIGTSQWWKNMREKAPADVQQHDIAPASPESSAITEARGAGEIGPYVTQHAEIISRVAPPTLSNNRL